MPTYSIDDFYMKIKIALLSIGLLAGLTLSHVPAKAQTQTDTSTIVTPIFSGNEKTLADTLTSIQSKLNDPELKATIGKVITTVQTIPKNASIGTWAAWIVTVLSVLFAGYHYLSASLAKQAVKQNDNLASINTSLKTIASPSNKPAVNVTKSPPGAGAVNI